MAVFRIDAKRDGSLAGPAGWKQRLTALLDALPPFAPVCIFVHGYRYTWATPGANPRAGSRRIAEAPGEFPETVPCTTCNPHRLLYTGGASWSRQLGFSESSTRDGLAIAFGWEGRSFRSGGPARSFARIYRDAAATGEALAELVAHIDAVRPGTEVDFLAHSLGARVVLHAMRAHPQSPYGRAILMGAAEYADPAGEAVERAESATIYHILSRANDPFDGLFALGTAQESLRHGPTLGVSGLNKPHRRWLNVQLDHPQLRAWLLGRAHYLQLETTLSHWHFYTDPGAMSFYRSILRQRIATEIATLLAEGFPDLLEPRWARLGSAFAGGIAGTRSRGPRREGPFGDASLGGAPLAAP